MSTKASSLRIFSLEQDFRQPKDTDFHEQF